MSRSNSGARRPSALSRQSRSHIVRDSSGDDSDPMLPETSSQPGEIETAPPQPASATTVPSNQSENDCLAPSTASRSSSATIQPQGQGGFVFEQRSQSGRRNGDHQYQSSSSISEMAATPSHNSDNDFFNMYSAIEQHSSNQHSHSNHTVQPPSITQPPHREYYPSTTEQLLPPSFDDLLRTSQNRDFNNNNSANNHGCTGQGMSFCNPTTTPNVQFRTPNIPHPPQNYSAPSVTAATPNMPRLPQNYSAPPVTATIPTMPHPPQNYSAPPVTATIPTMPHPPQNYSAPPVTATIPTMPHPPQNYSVPPATPARTPSNHLQNSGHFSGTNSLSPGTSHIGTTQQLPSTVRNAINALRTANTTVTALLPHVGASFLPQNRPQRPFSGSPNLQKYKFKVHLLPGPVTAPLNNHITQLYTDDGLGRKDLKLYRHYTKEQVDTCIRRKYPQLGTTTYGIYQQSPTGAPGSAVFLRVCPSVPRISVFWENKRRIHYIRPDRNIWDVPANAEPSSESDSADEPEPPSPPPTPTTIVPAGPPSNNTDVDMTPVSRILPPPLPSLMSGASQERTLQAYFDAHRLSGTRTIRINRDTFEQQFLNEYRTETPENVFIPLRIEFENEPGFDAGGLSREYFSLLRHELLHGTVDDSPIFEGNGNHLLLTFDPDFVTNNIYYLAGLACADLALHCGFAFEGLSLCMIDLLKHPLCSVLNKVTYSLDDISQWDVMECIMTLTSIADRTPVTAADKNDCIQVADEWNVHIPLTVCSDDALWYKKLVMESFLIGKRLVPVCQFGKGLRDGGLLLYFEETESGFAKVFPRMGATTVTVEDIRSKLRYTGHVAVMHRLETLMEALLRQMEGDNDAVKELLLHWTGANHLTRGPLTVNAIDNGNPHFHSCTAVFDVPIDVPVEVFLAAMSGSHNLRFTNQ